MGVLVKKTGAFKELQGGIVDGKVLNALWWKDSGTWKKMWENWVLKTTRTLVGSAGNSGFVNTEKFDWTVPSNYRVVKLYCSASVKCHVNITDDQIANGELPAMVTAIIQGYNGSSWVELSKSSTGESKTQGETVTMTCSFTFDPYNTKYTKFRFISSGSSFYRTVTGYVDEWYQKGN